MLFKTLLVIVLSVSGVLSQWSWRVTYTPERICALKGSSVDMSCTYSYPPYHKVQKTFWFIHWNEPQEPEDLSFNSEYSHRVEYLGNKHSDSTFRINQLKESDSALYRFRFVTDHFGGKYTGNPGVSLTVTGLQVKVTENEAQSVTLTCSSTCTLSGSPTFTWYKNGKIVPYEYKYTLNLQFLQNTARKYQQDDYLQFKASSGDAGNYSCAVTGRENLLSPAVTLYPPKSTSVSVSPSGEILEGSSVTLTCSSAANPPVQRYTWFKKIETGVQQSEFLWRRSEWSYTIKNITLQDVGEYICEAENVIGTNRSPPKRLDVQYPPKSTSVSVSPSGEIVEGSSVTLTCSSDANPPVQRYTWYKNNRDVSSETGGPEDSYTIKTITLQDAGEYTCQAGNRIGTNKSPPRRLDVQYPPKSISVSVSPSGEIVEGTSVTLTCSSAANPPVQKYTWYKNNRAVSSWRGSSYTIKSITLQDAVEYYCEAQNGIGTERSPPKRLDVKYPPKSTSVSVSPSGEILEGSSVTLTCMNNANPPVQNYTWFKNNRAVSSETGGPDDSYTIKTITLQDAGEYYCEAQNGIETYRSPPKRLDVQYAPKNTSVSVSPSGEIVEGSSVTLTCSSDANPPVQNYTWFRKNDTGVWQAGSGQSLNFSDFRSWNRGQYYCEAQNRLGAQNASALLVLIQVLQTGSERIVSFSNFTSWSFGQYYCVALNTHGDQTSAAGDRTALVWMVVGITVAFALFAVMVCTSRKKSTNRERGRIRHSRTSRAFRE